MPTVTLSSNNGFGWTVGDAGSKKVELTSERGFGWTASVSAAEVTPPAITGAAQVGSTLTVTPSSRPGAKTYQWLADGVAIPGATGPTYLITEDDEGADIYVTETVDGEALDSEQVGPVVA